MLLLGRCALLSALAWGQQHPPRSGPKARRSKGRRDGARRLEDTTVPTSAPTSDADVADAGPPSRRRRTGVPTEQDPTPAPTSPPSAVPTSPTTVPTSSRRPCRHRRRRRPPTPTFGADADGVFPQADRRPDVRADVGANAHVPADDQSDSRPTHVPTSVPTQPATARRPSRPRGADGRADAHAGVLRRAPI